MENTKKVVTRFAPSPTGHMHTGSYRTAFFAYLFAKKHGGKFVLRIEDTDKERSEQKYTDEIFKVFDIIGITADEKYIQSEHVGRHTELLQKLIDDGKAYISREEAKDGSGVMKDIIRFKNPNKVVTFTDLIRGDISTDTTDLGDFVLAKNLYEPLFHLAVVIDDHDEGITHVIRAEEHIANTPRQILIHEALGFDIPNYAHLPLVLAPDKTKMSKRKGAVPVVEYLERGYLPGALLNAICLCGWNPGTEQEIFSREELEQTFDLDKVQKAGAVFNEEKLDWFNREYIKKLSSDEFWAQAETYIAKDIKIENLLRERIVKFSDIKGMVESGELSWYLEKPKIYDLELLIWKAYKQKLDYTFPEYIKKVKKILNDIIPLIESIPDDSWTKENIKNAIWSFVENTGRGEVLWPMRVALSGKEKSPDPFDLSFVLGKEETLLRLTTVAA